MLLDEIKKRITLAMKEKRIVEREILRLAASEIQAHENRTAQPASEEEAAKIIKKLIKSNTETLEAKRGDAAANLALEEEIKILESLLPKTWSVNQIAAALLSVQAELMAQKSDGQATGVAVKHLKTLNAVVEGKDVAAAVKKVRGG